MTSISASSASKSAARIISIILILLGTLLVAYAISDDPLYGGEPGFGLTQVLISIAGIIIGLCSLLPTRIAGNILLLTISILVVLAFAEKIGETLLGSRFRRNFQFDDRLIFKFIPSRTSVMRRTPINGGETVTYPINSDGYRGPELLPVGNATRIVVYGDSFIHAFYSPQEETFVGQLGSLLTKRVGKQIEVVNAGVSSYGPDQESLKMADELPRLRPNLVIVAIFAGNDYGDLMRDKMFKLGTNGELVENHWQLDPSTRALLKLSQQESILKLALRQVLGAQRPLPGHNSHPDNDDHSNIDFLLKEAQREYRSFIVESNNIVTNTMIDYYSADVSLTPRSESARYKVALMRAVMRRIRDVAQQNDTPLVFLFIPHPVDVADQYDSWTIDRKRFPDYNGRNQITPLEETAQALRVPFVSLYDTFLQHDANSLYFHVDDDHWNAAGQQLAAEVMADFLLSKNLLDTGTTVGVPQHDGTAQ